MLKDESLKIVVVVGTAKIVSLNTKRIKTCKMVGHVLHSLFEQTKQLGLLLSKWLSLF